MIGTYAAALAVCVASLAIGQAAIGLCGGRRWSWLAPAVGLALLCAVCWGTVRSAGRRGGLGDRRRAAGAGLGRLPAGARRRGRGRGAGAPGWPVALVAAARGFAAVRRRRPLRDPRHQLQPRHVPAPAGRRPAGERADLAAAPPGLPARPARDRRRPRQGPRHRPGPGLQRPHRRGRGARAADARWPPSATCRPLPRTAAALVVGLAYVVASYFAQGAFKETIAGALRPRLRAWRCGSRRGTWAGSPAALRPGGADRGRRRLRLQLPRPLWLVGTFASGRWELLSRTHLRVAWGRVPARRMRASEPVGDAATTARSCRRPARSAS